MTIIENVIAGAIVVCFLSGLFALSSHSMGRLHAQKETAAVNLCLQQRVEQVRAATWTQITTTAGITKTLTAAVPGSEKLPHLEEVITVNIYPPPNPSPTPIAVIREANGTVRTLSEPVDGSFSNASLVRVDFSESWKSGHSMRPRLRETSTVIALGGDRKMRPAPGVGALRPGASAFTFVELLVAASIAVMIVGALLVASITLQRGFSAAVDQSGAQRDQMRVVDYITRDLRRATAVTVTNNGSKLTLSIPDHHDQPGPGIRVPTISAEGLVAYGNPPRTVSYFVEGATFLRIEEGVEKVIANTVEQFQVVQSTPSVVTFSIGFSPRFSWRRAGSAPATLSSTVFLRNARGGFVL